MRIQFTIHFLVLFCLLITGNQATAYSQPREQLVEEALLQQLHPVIVSSLKEINKEAYSQYGCERIVSINERVTIKNKDNKAMPADAIHGANYFEITVTICRSPSENVELILKNDSAMAQYYMAGYKIAASD